MSEKNMSEKITLETTKDALHAAASKCSQVREVLQDLFPQYFEPEINLREIDFQYYGISGWILCDSVYGNILLDNSEANSNKIKLRSFNDSYRWKIEGNYLVLEKR